MNSQDNPLTEHDAAFMKACLDAINGHPHKGALEVTYNLSLMYFSALCRIAEQCAEGREAGLLMSMMIAGTLFYFHRRGWLSSTPIEPHESTVANNDTSVPGVSRRIVIQNDSEIMQRYAA